MFMHEKNLGINPFFNDIAVGSIVGFGFDGYEFALDKIMRGKDGS